MRERVVANFVPLVDGPLHLCRIAAHILSNDVKCRVNVIPCQNVQYLISVTARAVVES